MADTPLPEQDKLSCVLVLSGFVRNDATLTADFAAAVRRRAGDARLRHAAVADHRAPTSFPSLHRAIASGALDDEDDLDVEFEFGLARILDGIDALIRRR